MYLLQAAINKLDQQVCESIKKLNALKHQRNVKEKKLRELSTEYDQMVTDAEDAVNTDAGESEDAQVNIIININYELQVNEQKYLHIVLQPVVQCTKGK